MERQEIIPVSLGVIWGLAGAIWITMLLGTIRGGFPSYLPFFIHVLVSLPAYLWWLASHQIYESFQFPPIFFVSFLVIPSTLIGGAIGYGINKLVEELQS
ncbi:hypothetical protein AKJ64_04025 [candidate division MSBL1 archaeon SCGC-AAA259E17]|uniref:Uncharacterized protein n=1 Tax=candidate division MSBL1 archaeon SCGC-AAA259E17 TaxID=1698263 RepID=A0A133UD53_9EURY|nr:hypothetical protein AKJ64_04025 [candidate division MSBL1 archaeon SCGC-AAA259E17]